MERFSIADEAATAEEDEGEIQEDQKLEPSREGASEDALAAAEAATDFEDPEAAELEALGPRVSGGSASVAAGRLELGAAVFAACDEFTPAGVMLGSACSAGRRLYHLVGNEVRPPTADGETDTDAGSARWCEGVFAKVDDGHNDDDDEFDGDGERD